MNPKPKTMVKMRIEAAAPSHSRAYFRVRNLRFAIDEPVETARYYPLSNLLRAAGTDIVETWRKT